jgi:agrin, putative
VVKLIAKRYLKDGVLTIVGQEDTFGKSLGDLKSLDLAESLYIGNIAANVSEVIDNIGVDQGFVGCIHKLKIGRKNVDLSYSASQSYESQAKFFEVHDCTSITCYRGNSCLNHGVCMPILNNHNLYSKDSFKCKCDTPFGGKYCEIRLDVCTSESPCIKGSTCINLPKGGFSCLCSKEKSHQLCSQSKPLY